MRVITPTAVLVNGLLRYIPGKGRFISSSRSFFYRSKRIDNIEEILNRIVVEDYERRKQDDERRKQDDERLKEVQKLDQEEHRKMRRSLTDLIGYNQNVDKTLEVSMETSFKNFLVHTLKIPESCIRECDEHKIFDPKTGDTAVEWDGIFIIDYSELSNNDNGSFFQPPESWPAHHTVFLLEVKQMLNATSVFEKMPERIRKTVVSLTSTTVSRKKKVKAKIELQQARFPRDAMFTVAIGGKNVRGAIEKDILRNGYLAIRPSGKDFKVMQSPKHRAKLFNVSSFEIED
eukprot:gene36852-49704_t